MKNLIKFCSLKSLVLRLTAKVYPDFYVWKISVGKNMQMVVESLSFHKYHEFNAKMGSLIVLKGEILEVILQFIVWIARETR